MTLIAWALLFAVAKGWLLWWHAVTITAAWWWLTLPANTWRDFNAGMNIQRVSRGGGVTLPPEPQRCLEPDHERLVRWQLWVPAAFKNWVFAHTWGSLYFGRLGHWRDRGFTDRVNRLRAQGGRIGDRAERVAVRWLHRFDSRGRHT